MQHKLLRPRLILAAVAGLALLLIVAAELSVRFEPVTTVAAAPDGEYVRLQADARLFTLFAALNAGGYDEENNEQGMSDVRRQVRATLAQPGGETPPLPAALRPYLALCRTIHVSQCATWILQRGPAPDFARAVDGWTVTAPADPQSRPHPRGAGAAGRNRARSRLRHGLLFDPPGAAGRPPGEGHLR